MSRGSRTRREFLHGAASAGIGVGFACAAVGGGLLPAVAGDLPKGLSLLGLKWRKDPNNPILLPGHEGADDAQACMTPRLVVRDDEYWLYYSGGSADGKRRVCLAVAPRERPTEFVRKGVVLDVGGDGAFDEHWTVGPRVCRIGERWHLYYTALPKGGWSRGLQSISGIGLAQSDDGVNWKKYGEGPVLTGGKTKEFPGNKGIGGGGPPLKVTNPDGTHHWRMYLTLAVGTKSPDPRIDQHKVGVVCHSTDGIRWDDYRVVMDRRPEVDREDYGANYLVVWHDGQLYRCMHGCIGSRWGYYSIGEAVSRDGYTWYRGQGDDNLVLGPTEDKSWEGQMVAYPTVVQEGRLLRMYYCGNGYGRTGIGTAVAELPPGYNIDEGAA